MMMIMYFLLLHIVFTNTIYSQAYIYVCMYLFTESSMLDTVSLGFVAPLQYSSSIGLNLDRRLDGLCGATIAGDMGGAGKWLSSYC